MNTYFLLWVSILIVPHILPPQCVPSAIHLIPGYDPMGTLWVRVVFRVLLNAGEGDRWCMNGQNDKRRAERKRAKTFSFHRMFFMTSLRM